MHPHSTESSSECMCCLYKQQATGWEERSLWQQMWNCVAELTSKICDSRETEPQCFSNQYGKHLNNLLPHCPECPCVLRVTSASRTAGNCCLRHLSPRFVKQCRITSSLQQWCGIPALSSRRGGAGLVASQDLCQGLSWTPQTSGLTLPGLHCTGGVGNVWKPKQRREKAVRSHLRQVPASGEHSGGHKH